jgi:hypothetical protein
VGAQTRVVAWTLAAAVAFAETNFCVRLLVEYYREENQGLPVNRGVFSMLNVKVRQHISTIPKKKRDNENVGIVFFIKVIQAITQHTQISSARNVA